MVNRDGECPVCEGSFGRIEATEIEGVPARRYWHTDLESSKRFCVERADGETDQVERGRPVARVE